MNARLRGMFAAIGVLVLGGVSYTVAVLKPEFNTADAVDAGVLTVSVPAQVRCRVRVKESCRLDGGRAYRVVRMKARVVTGTNPDTLLIDPNRDEQGERCLVPVGTSAEACDIIEQGACTDSSVCGANAEPQADPDQCACRAAGQMCRFGDGGVAPFGAALRAGIEGFAGPGCVRYFCGPVINGENGVAWPAECPQ